MNLRRSASPRRPPLPDGPAHGFRHRYIAAQSAADLLTGHQAEGSLIGVALTAVALLEMPLLGSSKHKLGTRLGSGATIGEGTQNYLCGVQAAAVLFVLAITPYWPGGWWLDPIVGLGIAAYLDTAQDHRDHDEVKILRRADRSSLCPTLR